MSLLCYADTTLVDIRNHEITTIQANAFINAPNIERIYLENNLIDHIDGDAFSNLPNLTQVRFVDNHLGQLPAFPADVANGIHTYSVTRDTIDAIQQGYFDDFSSLVNLELSILGVIQSHA